LADFLYLLIRMKVSKSFYSVFILFFLCFGMSNAGYSQTGFRLPNNKKKDKIAFELVNNLVIIPVEVNGKKLSFLLDTGVNHTLLFSLDENDSLEINNATHIKIRGLGNGGYINALKSVNNTLKIGDAVDRNHKINVIFDKNVNFSPRMGIPIHGVIGYEFFRDFVVKIDYGSKRITIYDPKQYQPKRCKPCETFNIVLSSHKPYIKTHITSMNKKYERVLLIDSGASDALWLFNENYGIQEDPKNYFNDFLGLGLSGNVYGKRSKIDKFFLGKFSLNNVSVSYPDTLALKNLRLNGTRSGTLGSSILKRFTVIMDYSSKKMTLRKNSFYNKPFNYNMAGIVIEHDGIIPVKEVRDKLKETVRAQHDSRTSSAVKIDINPFFRFFLAPKLVIAEVRKDSPADIAGVYKGDEVLAINGKSFYLWKLAEVNALFFSKSGRKIVLEISRNGIKIKKRFVLKKVL